MNCDSKSMNRDSMNRDSNSMKRTPSVSALASWLLLLSGFASSAPDVVHAQETELGFEHLAGIDVVLAFDDPTANRVLESAFQESLGRRMGINLLAAAQPDALSVVAVATCVPQDCASAEYYSVALLLSNHYDATWAIELLSHESQELADLYAPRVAELMEPLGIWAEAWRPGEYRAQVDAFVDQLETRCFGPALARRGIIAALALGEQRARPTAGSGGRRRTGALLADPA